jgi:hypothetical protein
MKSVIEEGFIGVDMPPLPDEIWRGVRLLQLTEEVTVTTTSDTFTAWLSPVTEAVTYSGTASLYGIICDNNPVKYIDWDGLKAGDPYPSEDAAVKDAIKDYTSWNQLVERGGLIYRITNPDGSVYYSYVEAVVGHAFWVNTAENDCKMPKNGEKIGYWHSHTIFGRSTTGGFSPTDMNTYNQFSQGVFWMKNNMGGDVWRWQKTQGQPDTFQRWP